MCKIFLKQGKNDSNYKKIVTYFLLTKSVALKFMANNTTNENIKTVINISKDIGENISKKISKHIIKELSNICTSYII